jgi:putative flippase GtrA
VEAYTVLIPAYQPDEKLVQLVAKLRDKGIAVTVVDDGGGPNYAHIFEQVSETGAYVLYHSENKGKGAALKTGISHLKKQAKVTGIVTADADGQHTPEDICLVMDTMAAQPDTLVIGARSFKGNVPARSRFGNTLTRGIFRLATGLKVTDTQTGLRGLPKRLFTQLCTLEGDRYEYEMNMLLSIERWGIDYTEVPIETVYIEGNKSSHFHPLRDSWLIYGKILKFLTSSLASFVVDYGMFLLLSAVFGLEYWLCYVLARAVSSFVNYMINRHIVFANGRKSSVLKYYLLALVIMALGSTGVNLLTLAGIPGLLAKIMVDVPLFFVSYTVQRKYIFK